MNESNNVEYTIVYKPMGSHIWTPLRPDAHPAVKKAWKAWGLRADLIWSSDLLATMKRAQYLNRLGLSVKLGDGKRIDRMEFRHATVTIGDRAHATGLYDEAEVK